MDLVPSKQSCRLSPLLMLITKFVYNSPLKACLRLTYLQEAGAIRNKVENLLSRTTALDVIFATRPSDVAEQRRRSELIWYAILPPSGSVLNSFQ